MPSKQTDATQMNGRSIIPGLVGAATLIGLATGAVLEHQARLEQRDEQRALQQELDLVTDLLARNERQASFLVTATPSAASDPSAELLRLRVELGALRPLTNELERARIENTEAHAALDRYLASETAPKVATADFWPRNVWNFAGLGSPDDALRSFLWAMNSGNVKALLDGTTGELRQEMEKEFEGKSADETSIKVMDGTSNLKSVQLVGRETRSDDAVVLSARFEDGDQTHTAKVFLKKVASDWKIAGMKDN